MVISYNTSLLIMNVTLYYLIVFRRQMLSYMICCHSLFCCSGHNIGFFILDQRWPSARDIASTTSWTHRPTVSSWKLGLGKNASCLNRGLLLFCVRHHV